MAAQKSPIEHVLSVLTQNYKNFNGRACRAEYWWFFLFTIIVSLVTSFIARKIPFLGIISLVVSIALLIPGIAVSIRRMHDTDHRGWWVLCPLYNIILLILPGTNGNNRFGANPIA